MTSWSVSSLLTVAVPSGYFTLFLILQFFLSLSAQSAFTISWQVCSNFGSSSKNNEVLHV